MSIERFVMAFAGAVVILSLLLSRLHSGYWLFLTLFAGVNLFQAAFTSFCPLAIVLRFLGFKSGNVFDKK